MTLEKRITGRGDDGRPALGGRRRPRPASGRAVLLFGQHHRRVLPAFLRGAPGPARKRRVPRDWQPMPSARASGLASAAGRTSRRWPSSMRRKVAELCRFIESAEQAPGLEALGGSRRDERLSLPSRLQGGHGPDAEGVRRGAPRAARANRARSQRHGDRGDLRRRLQLQRPLLRAIERRAGHDALQLSRRRRRYRHPLRHRRVLARLDPGRRQRARRVRDPARRRSRLRWRATCRTAFRAPG